VFELKTPGAVYWPLLVIEYVGFLLCCLPLADCPKPASQPLIKIPSVSIAFSLLTGIISFLGASKFNQGIEIQQTMSELSDVLSICMPFGTPTETDLMSMRSVLLSRNLSTTKSSVKTPAWKPTFHKGKSTIKLQLTEYVRSYQHETKLGSPDETSVYGFITSNAELEGNTCFEVSITMNHRNQGSKLILEDVLVHPCVQPAESGISTLADMSSSYRLKFSPPLYDTKLVYFTTPVVSSPPIYGLYKLRSVEKSVEILLQLKLNEQIKNAFEYCEARIPFFNRGFVSHTDCKPSSGSVNVAVDRRTLIWNLGNRFPSRGAEVSLTATLQFAEIPEQEKMNYFDDPFCVGNNSYCQLNFKINDFTYSGCNIDQKYVQTSPPSKFKFLAVTEFISTEYKIWNFHGDSPLAV
ncbi:AP5M1 (predicted), partial [Pycnogonum litorale]